MSLGRAERARCLTHTLAFGGAPCYPVAILSLLSLGAREKDSGCSAHRGFNNRRFGYTYALHGTSGVCVREGEREREKA